MAVVSSERAGGEAARLLGQLGLTQNEAKAYASLLEGSPVAAAEVARRAGVPRPKVYEALASLQQKGFVVVTTSRTVLYRAILPQVALPAWLEQREHERRLTAEADERAAGELAALLPAQQHQGLPHELEYLEPLVGRARTTATLERLIDATERTRDMSQQPPFLQPQGRWNVAEVAARRRAVRVRVLYTPDAIRDPSRYAALAAAGGAVRVKPTVPMKLLVSDGVRAMLSLRDPATGEQGLTSAVVRHPDLVGPLQLLFQREWRQGRPIKEGVVG